MKKRIFPLMVTCVFLFGLSLAAAQTTAPTAPPNVLWIIREDVKPARGAAHERTEHGYAQFWAKAKVQNYYALDAMSGNLTESLFVTGYPSFEAFEKDFQAFGKATTGPMKAEYEALAQQEAGLVNGVRSMVAVFRPDLSYIPPSVIPLAQTRYFQIVTLRVRPGREADFAAGAKTYFEALKKANVEQPAAIFQAVSGAPQGTYLIFERMKSLKEMDGVPARQKAIAEAMGEENFKQLQKGAADTFTVVDSNLYAINPHMSYPAKEVAAADPAFWSPKPKAAAKTATATKKEGDKTGAAPAKTGGTK